MFRGSTEFSLDNTAVIGNKSDALVVKLKRISLILIMPTEKYQKN